MEQDVVIQYMDLIGGKVVPSESLGGCVHVYVNPNEDERKHLVDALEDRRAHAGFGPGPRRAGPPGVRARPRGDHLQAAAELLQRGPLRVQGGLDGPVPLRRQAGHRALAKTCRCSRASSSPRSRRCQDLRAEDHLQLDLPFRRAPEGDQRRLRLAGGADQHLDAEQVPAEPVQPGEEPGLLPQRHQLQRQADRAAEEQRRQDRLHRRRTWSSSTT